MLSSGEKVLVTGGCGFIGSHLVDRLVNSGFSVCVVDNLSSGSLENVKHLFDGFDFRFIYGDLLKPETFINVVKEYDFVFHLAANPEVRVGFVSPDVHFQQNVIATYNLLEALRVAGNVKTLVFTSSSTVYGEAEVPTPENYSLLKPISVYGASKLACEALISGLTITGFMNLPFVFL